MNPTNTVSPVSPKGLKITQDGREYQWKGYKYPEAGDYVIVENRLVPHNHTVQNHCFRPTLPAVDPLKAVIEFGGRRFQQVALDNVIREGEWRFLQDGTFEQWPYSHQSYGTCHTFREVA